MQKALCALVLLVGLLLCQVSWVDAVGADSTGLGFNTAGQKVVDTGRNVFVPVLVIGAVLVLAVLVLVGGRVAGQAVRTVIACVLLVVVLTGAGIATFFPGLITTGTLP